MHTKAQYVNDLLEFLPHLLDVNHFSPVFYGVKVYLHFTPFTGIQSVNLQYCSSIAAIIMVFEATFPMKVMK